MPPSLEAENVEYADTAVICSDVNRQESLLYVKIDTTFRIRYCRLHFEEALLSWTTEEEPDRDAGTIGEVIGNRIGL